MTITFIGATHEVTGSCTLLTVGNTHILVDCGMEQGNDTFQNSELPVSPSDIDLVVLTHAHIDHSGNLPLLYKNGFKGKIYATEATCNLCAIMLRDSAHIQMFEAEWRNRKGKRAGEEPYLPIYDMNDAEGAISQLRRCSYSDRIRVSENVDIRFNDIGHLLGSAAVEIWLIENDETRKTVFSGDVGNVEQPILKNPSNVAEGDYVVIESTYGDRLHPEVHDYISELTGYIQKTFDRGGNVVVPSFAVGRTQELLYFLRYIKEKGLIKNHPDFPVYVDSPLAIEATSVFMQSDTRYFDEETVALIKKGINPIYFDDIRISLHSDDSRAINFDNTPKVIISASGMCEAGRIRHHLKHNLWRKECLVLFVGYQAEGTLGRSILDGTKKVKLFGEEICVNAEIGFMNGVSGHADKNGLIDWLKGFDKMPSKVFVNHGEDMVCTSFAECLKNEYGYDTAAPYSGTTFDLLTGNETVATVGIPVSSRPLGRKGKKRSAEVLDRLVKTAMHLVEVTKSCEGMANKDLAKFTSQIENLISKWNNE